MEPSRTRSVPVAAVWLCAAWLGVACGSKNDGSGTNTAGGGSGGSGGMGAAGEGSGGDRPASGGSSATGGTAGSTGGAGQEVDLDDIGTPCDGGECPPGLSPLEYCGLDGCSMITHCSCEIPCEGNASVCPSGTVCASVSDGPGEVCVR